MDGGEAWWLTKLVFWGILIFIILKLGLTLLLMKIEPQHPILGLNSLGCSYRGRANGWVEETVGPVHCSRSLYRPLQSLPLDTNAHWVGLRVAMKSRACFHFETISCRLWLRSPLGRLTEQFLLRRFQLLM
jgi:hypothetical protein